MPEGQVKVTGQSAPEGGLPSRKRLGMESGSPLSLRLRKKLRALAATDPSPVVRLYLASALQRLPAVQRLPVAQALVTHDEDARDANLPLLIWYGIEPLVSTDNMASATLRPTTGPPPLARCRPRGDSRVE